MNERLAFGYGTGAYTPGERLPSRLTPAAPAVTRHEAAVEAAPPRERRRDWAFLGLLAFTGVLYFRPQDQIPGLSAVPFAEICAIVALVAMVTGRLSRGLPVTRVTPELAGVAGLGFVILLTAPFSIWPGGAVHTFTDVFAKVILIFVLMTNTLTTTERLYRFMSVVVLATGYIATRAVFDYARGINLIENGRVQGAVGGMFGNPNDLALNMVAILPLAVLLAIWARTTLGRLGAAFLSMMMISAVMVSYSRGGFVGLAVMLLILGMQVARRKPAVAGVGALLLLFAVPFAPSSYWERVASITDDSLDATGSREARRILLTEAWNTFLTFPFTGVGAGQFANYNPPERLEIWRETHNVALQVAAELGIVGVAVFLFLLYRSFAVGRLTHRLVKRARGLTPRPAWQAHAPPPPPAIGRDEAAYYDAHAAALTSAIVGWLVCAMFASVAYSWTFYYLLALAAAPVGILHQRLAAARHVEAPSLRGEERV
jgi:putative inorganic carbon (HCO3(-)) transporter